MVIKVGNNHVIPSNVSKQFPEICRKIKQELKLHPEKKGDVVRACEVLNHTKLYKISGQRKVSFSPISALINKATVLRGAWKFWDPIRLLTGKHESLSQIGAEHVQIQNRLGDKIDATHVDVASFAEAMKKFGGEKCLFNPRVDKKAINPWKGSYENIILQKGEAVKALRINMLALFQGADLEYITEFYQSMGYVVHQDLGSDEDPNSGGDIFIISREDDARLRKSSYMQAGDLRDPQTVKNLKGEQTLFSNLDSLKTPFSGYYFDTYSENLNQILNKLDINKSQWRYQKIGDHGYLLKVWDIKKIELMEMSRSECLKFDRYPSSPIAVKNTGTVLLAMNQNEVYEQHCSELLTFLLEDINVMAYNNGGKGLSVGSTGIDNIKEAAECAYQYLHEVKKIPDEKIDAKGQCFGGAPTAWLGAKHPKINLMIDQSPANFHEVASKEIRIELEKKMKAIGDPTSLKYKFYSVLHKSKVIDALTKAVLIGFNLARDIKKNQGNNLLHVNVPTPTGLGGDKLVPGHHPMRILDSFAMRPDRIYALTENPGATHVTSWFLNPACYTNVIDFFNKTYLAPNVYNNSLAMKRTLKIRRVYQRKIEKTLKSYNRKIQNIQEGEKKGSGTHRDAALEWIRQIHEFKKQINLELSNYLKDASLSEDPADVNRAQTLVVDPLRIMLNRLDASLNILNQLSIPVPPPLPPRKK